MARLYFVLFALFGLQSMIRADPNMTTSTSALLLSYAAYCPFDKITSWQCYWCQNANIPQISNVMTSYDAGTDCFSFVGIDHDRIVVVFRGTELISIKGWLGNADFVQVTPYSDLPQIQVHRGFWNGWQSIRTSTLKNIQAAQARCPNCPLLLAGHSLGGSLSTVAAVELYRLGQSNIQLYTYGSPRVGNDDFVAYFQKTGVYSLRTVNNADTVPHVPFEALNYLHVATENWYDGQSWHYCSSSGEDPNCSASLEWPWQWSVSDHATYLGFNWFEGTAYLCAVNDNTGPPHLQR